MNNCIFCEQECDQFVCNQCKQKEFGSWYKTEEYKYFLLQDICNEIDKTIKKYIDQNKRNFIDIEHDKTKYKEYFNKILNPLIKQSLDLYKNMY